MTARGRTGARRPRDRQRGNIAILFALLLPVLLGFAALVIDLGHGWQVRNQLQNDADSAALAGVRDLDGTAARFATAINSAVQYAALNSANGSSVTLPASNVTLGNWNFNTRTFTAASASTPPYKVNAVSVTAPTLTLRTWFAPILGINSENVTTAAIAVGGSPDATCGFPLAVPACSIINDDGTIRCNTTLTFGQATTDNVGFTVFTPTSPVDTNNVECLMSIALGQCPPKTGPPCTCTTTCNTTSVASGSIYISNGNNLAQNDIDMINSYLAANPGGLYVQVPVLDSGSLTKSSCGSFQFNKAIPVDGYVEMHITGATSTPTKSVTATIDCTKTGSAPPGGTGGFFGYKSTNVYLVK
ncbi:MAG TPA: pilus assembly protein TadG-related protein [Polyangia bacterium]